MKTDAPRGAADSDVVDEHAVIERFDDMVDAAFDRLRGNVVADRVFYTASEIADFSLLWHLLGVSQALRSPRHQRRALRLSVALAAESLLVNGLVNAVETRPAKAESAGQGDGPSCPVWTHRFNPPGAEPPRYELLDHIWLSPALAATLRGAHIDRRMKHGGDGSDHDPAWIELHL